MRKGKVFFEGKKGKRNGKEKEKENELFGFGGGE